MYKKCLECEGSGRYFDKFKKKLKSCESCLGTGMMRNGSGFVKEDIKSENSVLQNIAAIEVEVRKRGRKKNDRG